MTLSKLSKIDHIVPFYIYAFLALAVYYLPKSTVDYYSLISGFGDLAYLFFTVVFSVLCLLLPIIALILRPLKNNLYRLVCMYIVISLQVISSIYLPQNYLSGYILLAIYQLAFVVTRYFSKKFLDAATI